MPGENGRSEMADSGGHVPSLIVEYESGRSPKQIKRCAAGRPFWVGKYSLADAAAAGDRRVTGLISSC